MTQKSRSPYRFLLSAGAADDEATAAWLELIQALCLLMDASAQVQLDRPGPLLAALPQLDRLEIMQPGAGHGFEHDRAGQNLVVISDSAVLSRALLSRFDMFHVQVQTAPTRLNVELWLELLPFACQGAAALVVSASAAPWRPDCALLSSVYDGDDYLNAFLDNCAALDGYAQMEHFLVRAASPGNEHEALVRHVQQHPGAVYIRLQEDPGLYEVWNLCSRLASAPYLTSANIDDRRAPQHIARLVEILDRAPDVDVASTALRITEQKNLPWADSAQCPVWYADGRSGPYHVERLWRGQESRLVPHNIPHCMPVWRAQLHTRNGYFDEAAFGASADWEFWLRAGKQGARFYLLTEPLGLHLRRADSYWRRHAEHGQDPHTRHIIQTHITAPSPPGVRARLGWFTARWRELESSKKQADWLRYWWLLAELGQALDRPGLVRLPFRLRLKARIRRELGFTPAHPGMAPPVEQDKIEGLARPVSRLFRFMVDSGHAARAAPDEGKALAGLLKPALRRMLAGSSALELYIALAWAHGLAGDRQAGRSLLAYACRLDRQRFWLSVQAIYRFTVSLKELGAMLEPPLVFGDFSEIGADQTVFFYPDYSAGNPYQAQLYRQLEARGVSVVGINDIQHPDSGSPVPKAGDVLHIHWINRLYRDIEASQYGQAIENFLARLRELRSRQVNIYWTVHNRYSHDFPDVALEQAFRRHLCELADQVFLHHPCLRHELDDWLPDTCDLRFIEHGSYIGLYENSITRQQARKKLGFKTTDRVLAIIGMIKPYKQLAPRFGELSAALLRTPDLKLVIAGPVHCEASRQMITRLPAAQVVIQDRFLPAEEIQTYLKAADFAFFSYRDILTSGSLIQALGFGVPVIAPDLGSLPAYVVDGWNGIVYRPGDGFDEILARISRYDAMSMTKMGQNALATAGSLKWP